VSDVRPRIGHGSVTTHSERLSVLWDGHTRGGEVAALATALTLTVATVEVTFAGHLGLFFDLCFVVICLVAALMVRKRDFFTVGVLPPLLMFATMILVALNGTQVIASAHDSIVQAVVTGLARHSVALFAGYAVCLLALLARQRLPRP
jgi:ATP/ADP translocase